MKSITKERYLQSIQGIGNILCYEAKKGNRQFISRHLSEFKKIILKMFEYYEKDFARFKDIVTSSQFATLAKDPLRGFRLIHRSEEYLDGFAVPVEQLDRICRAAVESGYLFICDEIMGVWGDFLLEIIKYTLRDELIRREAFVNFVLEKIIRINENEKMRALVSDDLLTDWYLEPVFLSVKNGKEAEWKFNLELLPIFNRYFGVALIQLVDKNRIEQFKRCIQHIAVDETLGQEKDPGYGKELSDYRELLAGAEQGPFSASYYKLKDNIKYLCRQRQSAQWNDDFQKIVTVIRNVAPADNEFEEDIKKESAQFAKIYRYNSLLRIIFSVGAYALRNKKYDFVECIFNYDELRYSSGQAVKNPIIPDNFDFLAIFFGFIFGIEHRIFNDDFITYFDKEKNEMKYLLCLTVRIIRRWEPDPCKFKIPNEVSKENIKKVVPELRSIGENIFQDKELVRMLDLSGDMGWWKKFEDFLEQLKVQVQ
ncbi:MAG TPA: hypothetical protein PLB05_09910 [Candidatus Omnitrophota bacterium]|nr:hypothetical protein [Candidatus Omnitrophota bacterium]HPN56575.1 hypothetical protein [Candidatus Omnitrophota bacterium]